MVIVLPTMIKQMPSIATRRAYTNIVSFVLIGHQFVGVRAVAMVFNATVNNISVIAWRSVLLVVEIYTPALYSRTH